MTDHDALLKIDDLLTEYGDWIGIADSDFPEHQPQTKACEFEDKVKAVLCSALGHDYIADQCRKPEHDYCVRCNVRREDAPT